MSVDVSVVIPCFNATRDLPAQLEALAGQSTVCTFEVVVSDNGSTDGLAEFVEEWSRRVPFMLRRVDASARRGVAHARNAGCRAALADVILVCDADDVVGVGWVDAMARALEQADLVGGTLVHGHLNTALVQQWRPTSPPGVLPTKLSHLPYAVGANVGLRREVFDALGGWDEGFVAGGDDVEFSWRAQHAGFCLRSAPDAVIAYRMRTTLSANVKQSYFYARSDALLMRTFRSAGVPRRGLRPLITESKWLVRNVPRTREPGFRGQWLRRAAMLAGRFVGSVQHRTWAV
ncbi:glycosyltransferase family 2 protein [Kineococcus radiotolerans]|uniref:Glycosyl transferase family 2 n=1 Tax=Kineococcus radiotolerans (strain ATCC BAA-149 / DSM 14245 / SRS30216) TaxID=266940 RepID=A6WEA2_KINRD|nr:glycosyltransferase [Kineococcus radiotolerans]ABS05141.1 glycosyl transferase family 2 [Kineococcus radiotolerans SRS30216 = ATCC BAA-149]